MSLIDIEVRIQLAARNWIDLGSNTYNPRVVRIVKRNQGYVLADLNVNDFEYEGRKVFKEHKEEVVLTYIIVATTEESFRKNRPQVLNRFYQIKNDLALSQGQKIEPKL